MSAALPPGATRWFKTGTATNSATILEGTANKKVTIELVVIVAASGGTWALGIGDTTGNAGRICAVEGVETATQARATSVVLDEFDFVGGGSATASENHVVLVADGAGECHYTVSGYTHD